IRHGIQIGIRPHDGPTRGQLEWRRPKICLVMRILKNPIYAGVYAYGRCPVDPKRRQTRRWLPLDQWKVLLRDHLPAYISWERYQVNLERLRQNRSRQESKGRPRRGTALLAGLVVCGSCGLRLQTVISEAHGRYECVDHMRKGMEKTCSGLSASRLDTL